MTPSRPAPLDSGIRGDTNLFGFVVTLNFNHELLSDSPSYAGVREADVPEIIRDHHMALTHEGIHFFHAMSTSYLYRLAVSLWREVQSCRTELRSMPVGTPIRLPVRGMERLGKMFADLGVKSTAVSCPEISGISALDVIEGAAVFISHRMHLPDIDHAGFLNRLNTLYGSGTSPYCDAYRLADWFLGDDLFDVFAPMCFLALCSVDPGLAYCRAVEIIGKSGILRRGRHPSFREIVDLAGATDIGDVRSAPDVIDDGGPHPILTAYIHQLIRERPNLPFDEFAARPYESGDAELFKYLVPPMVRYGDGRGCLSPKLPDLLSLATDTPENERVRQHSAFLIHFTAVCGAVLGMAQPADYYMQCRHRDCPYFSLRLCHAFAPIPDHYRDCGFIVTFQDVFGHPLRMVTR